MENEGNSKYNLKKTILPPLLMLILFLIATFFYTSFKQTPLIKNEPLKTDYWITIFTHGSFGSLLGLLNVIEVIQDNVSGTNYKKLISKMRKDDYFYKNQPILQKGLVKIEPSFNLSDSQNKKYAIYPITKAYEILLNQIRNKKEKNSFYTFGWSGLMSQKRRRIEAIRFYNAISEELQNYQQQGITPKIRIITHSHGGNLALNLAAVKKAIIYYGNEKELAANCKNNDERESLEEMLQTLKNTNPKKKNFSDKSQKNYDYIPINKNLTIDELLLFGTPIQPETEPFIFSGTFKKIYNFYSQEDSVQKLDWVSTKRYYSDQRFNLLSNIFGTEKEKKDNLPKVIQAKIMIRKNMPINTFIKDNENSLEKINTEEKIETNSFWSNLFYFIKKTDDPNHKELWFACWENEDLLGPIPATVFSPLFLNVIEKISPKINDIDLIINFTEERIRLYAFKHNKTKVQEKVSIYKWVVDEIKAKMQKWKPEDLSLSKEFEVIKKYNSSI